MSGKAVGRTAAALPWLCPNTDSLIRLAEAPATLARPCGADPALLAFLLRFTLPASAPHTGLFCSTALAGSSLPDAAGAYLAASHDGWLVPSEVTKRCRRLAHQASTFARRLAEQTRRADPDKAFALASLAPLGWLAVASVDAGRAAEALHDPDTPPIPALQAEVWGLDQNAIARRLSHRWRFPDWLASALGNLNLPLLAARALVADVGVFVVAQLAIAETEKRSVSLGLSHGADLAALRKELALSDSAVEELWAASAIPEEEKEESPSVLDPNPHKVPLVANLLKMAAESRRRNGASLVLRLEDRLDELHRGVAQVGLDAETRSRDSKLMALAELAAGAGHEINNPLAIISGHSQRLFRTEPDTQRGETLQKIIHQTDRIAGIIRDLMQFARPSQPNPRRCAASDLLQAVRNELSAFAEEKGVRVELGSVPATEFTRADYGQLKHALLAVVKNGIEAAGRDGWVRFGCIEGDEDFVRFVIEDSGPGLSAAAREHAFDPFFCGRSAGRGRGLGLPTAWQLVRQNGGELHHDTTSEGPTRFVLSVPRSITLEFLDRQSA